ncbi:MAG: hypothetical protein H7326_10005 [Bdellovibrionaceae bacterium]|nr:hypothetical protein [Pseudobdellovibrionaceae bacterium]
MKKNIVSDFLTIGFQFTIGFIIFLSQSASAADNLKKLDWQMWDVSILLPLPKTNQELKLLLDPQSQNELGVLIAPRIIHELPILVSRELNEQVFENQLKVIGIRIDPCFQDEAAPKSCARQIRLIWQPITSKNKQIVTVDAAVHTFYELTTQQWSEFVIQYESLLQQTTRPVQTELSIHPVIAKEGLNGKMWLQLKDLLLKYCGEKNISRITIMTLEGGGDQWSFSGFNITENSVQQLAIPKVFGKAQTIMAALVGSLDFLGTIMPINFSNLGLWFIDNSKIAKNKFPEKDFRIWTEDLLKIENPRVHNSGTTDCVSCHLSTNILSWQERNFSSWDWTSIRTTQGFTSSQNLLNTTIKKSPTQHLRAFGYQDTTARFSQRAINETALVLDWFHQK